MGRGDAALYLTGIAIGLFSFLVIGIFHPVVVKGEYYFSSKIWPVFLCFGLLFLGSSAMIKPVVISSVFGILGFTCLWSIGELRKQKEQVKKGWFPQNPNRKNKRREL
jgi:hypothetical protein